MYTHPDFTFEGTNIIVVDPEEYPDSGCGFAGNAKPTLIQICMGPHNGFLYFAPMML